MAGSSSVVDAGTHRAINHTTVIAEFEALLAAGIEMVSGRVFLHCACTEIAKDEGTERQTVSGSGALYKVTHVRPSAKGAEALQGLINFTQ